MIDPCRIRSSSEINMIDEFIVEDVNRNIQGLNSGIIKKFTSMATNATLFRWQFGDTQQNPIIETTENPYYHTFIAPGNYQVSHQSCYPCSGQLVCSSGWCTKSVSVAPPGKDLTVLALGGIFGFLIFIKRKECEDQETKKECDELKDRCQWIIEEKKCVKKCKEGYRLEKERIGDIKRPFRLKCVPEKSKIIKR